MKPPSPYDDDDALSIIGGHVPEARLTLVEPLEVVL